MKDWKSIRLGESPDEPGRIIANQEAQGWEFVSAIPVNGFTIGIFSRPQSNVVAMPARETALSTKIRNREKR